MKNSAGNTILHVAIKSKNLKVVEYLMTSFPVDLYEPRLKYPQMTVPKPAGM